MMSLMDPAMSEKLVAMVDKLNRMADDIAVIRDILERWDVDRFAWPKDGKRLLEKQGG